jgi:xanthine dehydrogenase iron-sulfur cluster and FAD-binding subunit A
MKPPVFEHIVVETVEEAVAALERHGDDAKLLAGGQSLMPILNMRLASPRYLVDLNRVQGLAYIDEREGGLAIGAMTRQRAAERSPLVAARVPLLAEALPWIGHIQIRNRGTIAGSLAHADPAAELPAVAVCLEAQFVVLGPGGARRVAARDLYRSYLTTALAPTEMITETWWPAAASATGYAWLEFARRSGDYALAGVAAAVTLDGEMIAEARLVLTGIGERPVRAEEAERALVGGAATAQVLEAAAELVRGAIDPEGDIHASADYRRHLAGVLTVRALGQAVDRARQPRGDACAGSAQRIESEPRAPAVVGPAGRTGVPVPDRSGPGDEMTRPARARDCESSARARLDSAGQAGSDPPAPRRVRVNVNGREYQANVVPRLLLSDFLRQRLGLTGTHVGCEHGVCGACTVLLEGAAVRSCLLLATQVDGAHLTTVEGLAPHADRLHPVQEAFRDTHGLQCGFCTPGFLLSTIELLRDNPSPDDAAIRQALAGHLCRCTGYQNIVRAVGRAAELLRA